MFLYFVSWVDLWGYYPSYTHEDICLRLFGVVIVRLLGRAEIISLQLLASSSQMCVGVCIGMCTGLCTVCLLPALSEEEK